MTLERGLMLALAGSKLRLLALQRVVPDEHLVQVRGTM